VLVIDDEPEVRTLLAELLANEGHDVVEAASGAEGLRALGKECVDVVVSDLVIAKPVTPPQSQPSHQ
jgi:two-component system response regulator GlrR